MSTIVAPAARPFCYSSSETLAKRRFSLVTTSIRQKARKFARPHNQSSRDGAAILLVVPVLVQQFDNDLLAPVVYGRALNLYPVVALLAITTGGTLFGPLGSFLAVPFTAVVVNMVAAGSVDRAQSPDERWVAAE